MPDESQPISPNPQSGETPVPITPAPEAANLEPAATDDDKSSGNWKQTVGKVVAGGAAAGMAVVGGVNAMDNSTPEPASGHEEVVTDAGTENPGDPIIVEDPNLLATTTTTTEAPAPTTTEPTPTTEPTTPTSEPQPGEPIPLPPGVDNFVGTPEEKDGQPYVFTQDPPKEDSGPELPITG